MFTFLVPGPISAVGCVTWRCFLRHLFGLEEIGIGAPSGTAPDGDVEGPVFFLLSVERPEFLGDWEMS